ncbi:chaperone modulator CbpM [Spirosoma fluminis]
MQTNSLISVSEFCVYHQVDVTFVDVLAQRGLIQVIMVEQVAYVQPDELPGLEKLVRLHQDLAIHADDLDVVSDLLKRIELLQHQITQLQNRLSFYEPLGDL